MWSGNTRPRFGASLIALPVLALGGCNLLPSSPSWYPADMMEQLRTQQEYSNFAAARYATLTGDTATAAEYYRRVSDDLPDDANLLERAAVATLAAGDTDAAVKLARGARSAAASGSQTVQLILIADDLRAGRTKQAQARLRGPMLGALNIDLSGYMSAWLTALGDPEAALAEVDALPARRMTAGEQAALKALVLMQAGRDEEAAEAFRAALRLPLATRDTVGALGARLEASHGHGDAARNMVALAASEDGDEGPESARVLADLDTGRSIVRPALDVRTGSALAVFLVSGTGLVRSSPDLSAMRHALALLIDPDLAPARMALADAFQRQGRPDDAIAALDAVPSTSPLGADARMEKAWILDDEAKPAEALAAADAALSLSQRRELVLRAGDLYRRNERLDVARRLYDQVAADDSAHARADWRVLFARATVHSEQGDWPGAEADLEAALAIEPDNPDLLNYLGYGWIVRGRRMQEGIALIQRAADARPDQGYIIDSLGWAHFSLGQYDKAIAYLEQACQLSPTDPEVADHLGDAYWRAGREIEARFAWERALRLKPGLARETDLHRKLASGLPSVSSATLASRP